MDNPKKHVYSFNNESNGGEQLLLVTEFHKNEPAITIIQRLVLCSYVNSAEFCLDGLLTPKKLRELADSLEVAMIENGV